MSAGQGFAGWFGYGVAPAVFTLLLIVGGAALVTTGLVLVVREVLRLRRGLRVWRAARASGEAPDLLAFTYLTPEQREAVVQAILDGHPGAWRS